MTMMNMMIMTEKKYLRQSKSCWSSTQSNHGKSKKKTYFTNCFFTDLIRFHFSSSFVSKKCQVFMLQHMLLFWFLTTIIPIETVII